MNENKGLDLKCTCIVHHVSKSMSKALIAETVEHAQSCNVSHSLDLFICRILVCFFLVFYLFIYLFTFCCSVVDN